MAEAAAQLRIALDQMGTATIAHPAIPARIRLVHLTDLHVLPDRFDHYPPEFARFITWQSRQLDQPNNGLVEACRQALAAKPDLVIVGGDMVDFLDERAMQIVLEQFAQFQMPVYYCRGNHEQPWSIDWQDTGTDSSNGAPTKTFTFMLSQEPFAGVAGRFGMAENPQTGRMDYAFTIRGVRFIVLDTSLGQLNAQQATWAAAQVDDVRPFIIVTHVPFAAPLLEPRIRLILRDMMLGHVAKDDACRRVLALTERPNFLAALAGHLHLRSEDALGQGYQLLTSAAAFAAYRVIDLLPGGVQPRIVQTDRNFCDIEQTSYSIIGDNHAAPCRK